MGCSQAGTCTNYCAFGSAELSGRVHLRRAGGMCFQGCRLGVHGSTLRPLSVSPCDPSHSPVPAATAPQEPKSSGRFGRDATADQIKAMAPGEGWPSTSCCNSCLRCKRDARRCGQNDECYGLAEMNISPGEVLCFPLNLASTAILTWPLAIMPAGSGGALNINMYGSAAKAPPPPPPPPSGAAGYVPARRGGGHVPPAAAAGGGGGGGSAAAAGHKAAAGSSKGGPAAAAGAKGDAKKGAAGGGVPIIIVPSGGSRARAQWCGCMGSGGECRRASGHW